MFEQPFMMAFDSINRSSLITLFDTSGLTNNSGINVADSGASTASRCGNIITAASSAIGQSCDFVKINVKKVGTPTGTWFVRIRRASDDIVVSQTTFDVSTMPTSNTLVTFSNFDVPRTLVADDRIMIESAGGDTSNYLEVRGSAVDTTGIDRTYYTGSYTNTTTITMLMVAEGLN